MSSGTGAAVRVNAGWSSGALPPHVGATNAAARVRIGGPEFEPSFRALRDAVQAACAGQREWQARIAVGLRAALEFAASDQAAARALTIRARQEEGGAAEREDEVLAYFAGLLARTAPAPKRVPVSSEAGLVDSIATIVRGQLQAGGAEELRQRPRPRLHDADALHGPG